MFFFSHTFFSKYTNDIQQFVNYCSKCFSCCWCHCFCQWSWPRSNCRNSTFSFCPLMFCYLIFCCCCCCCDDSQNRVKLLVALTSVLALEQHPTFSVPLIWARKWARLELALAPVLPVAQSTFQSTERWLWLGALKRMERGKKDLFLFLGE